MAYLQRLREDAARKRNLKKAKSARKRNLRTPRIARKRNLKYLKIARKRNIAPRNEVFIEPDRLRKTMKQ